MEEIKEKVDKFRIKFIGDVDWILFRDFLVLKLRECETEEQMTKIFEGIFSAAFRTPKDIDKTRKKLGLKLLTKKQKEKLNRYEKY
jgi:hypothetical protein